MINKFERQRKCAHVMFASVCITKKLQYEITIIIIHLQDRVIYTVQG